MEELSQWGQGHREGAGHSEGAWPGKGRDCSGQWERREEERGGAIGRGVATVERGRSHREKRGVASATAPPGGRGASFIVGGASGAAPGTVQKMAPKPPQMAPKWSRTGPETAPKWSLGPAGGRGVPHSTHGCSPAHRGGVPRHPKRGAMGLEASPGLRVPVSSPGQGPGPFSSRFPIGWRHLEGFGRPHISSPHWLGVGLH